MSNVTCLPRETLKQYLVGGINETQTIDIELHLAECEKCERTIVELESDPDTLLESLRADVSPSDPAAEGELPSVIQRAVTAARLNPITSIILPAPQITLTQIGAYDLLRPLGRGGMGIVVLARHRTLQKEVAVKLLTSLVAERADLVSRFQREIRTAGRLNHPAIVNATDAGQEQGTHYLVMEYIEGLDLSRIARITGPMAIADACELVRQAARGLSHAHSEGVVHRDIKPSNLMLDTTGQLKILDFGIAQLSRWDETACDLTTVGQLMGTLDYMAPEQAERSDTVDYRADLYALGATLFRLLVGRAPLAASPNMTLLEKVRLLGTQSAPSIGSFRDDCPLALVDLVRQMLSRDPAQRPASAAHVAEALQPFCVGSCLVDLLTRARNLSSQAAVAEPTAAVPNQAPLLKYADETSTSKKLYRRWLWAATSLVPLIFIAGILITLETQKGQLVIQSDVANVHVKVARDGQVVSELAIQPGAQSTRLWADKYEITIDSASDKISLDKQQFTIRNGETVVATIKQVGAGSAASKSVDSSSTNDRNSAQEPSSESPAATVATPRSVDEWIRELDRNLNLTIEAMDLRGRIAFQINALREIEKLTDATNSESVISQLLAIARRADLKLWSDSPSIQRAFYGGESRFSETLDLILFQSFREIERKDSFDNFRDSRLLMGDDQWTVRWFTALLKDRRGYSPGDEFRSRLLTDHALDHWGPATQQCAIQYLFYELMRDDDFAKRNAEAVVALAQKHLGITNTLLINQRFYHGLENSFPRDRGVLSEGEITVECAMAKFAKSIFIDTQVTPEQSALAAARLATSTDIVDSWKAELIPALQERLAALNASPDRLHLLLPKRDGCYAYDGIEQNFPATNIFLESGKRGRWGLSTPRHIQSELIACAALVKRLSASEDLSSELTKLAEKTADSYATVQALINLVSKKATQTFLVTRYLQSPMTLWPFEETTLHSLGDPLAEIPRNKWIEWAMFKELMSACRNSNSSMYRVIESVQTRAQEKSNGAHSTEEPVREIYRGRSLDEWLAILEKDREMETRIAAAHAVAALGDRVDTKALCERVIAIARNSEVGNDCEQLLRYLRSVHEPRYGLEWMNKETLDQAIFRCLKKLNSKNDFEDFVFKELLAGDDVWTTRWLAVLLKTRSNYSLGDEKLREPQTFNRFGKDSATLALAYLTYGMLLDEDQAKANINDVIKLAVAHPQLGRQSVLLMDPMLEQENTSALLRSNKVAVYSGSQKSGNFVVEEAVAMVAKEVLNDPNSVPEDLALAAGRLASTTGLVDRWRDDLVQVLRKRLAELSSSPDRLVVLLPTFNARHTGSIATKGFLFEKGYPGLRRYINSEVLSYNALVKRLSATSDLSNELATIVNLTSESWIELSMSVQNVESSLPSWPFDDSALKRFGEPLASIPREKWIQMAIFDDIAKQIKSISPNSPVALACRKTEAKFELRRLDKNQDGRLAVVELPPGTTFGDTNTDGFIELDEILSFWLEKLETKSRMMPPDAAQVAAPELAWAKRQIAMYDKNNDGSLSADEWSKMIVKPDAADFDGDGSITAEEFMKFRIHRK